MTDPPCGRARPLLSRLFSQARLRAALGRTGGSHGNAAGPLLGQTQRQSWTQGATKVCPALWRWGQGARGCCCLRAA